MSLLLFIVSILFIKGFDVGFALAIIGIVNFTIIVLKSVAKSIQETEEKYQKEEEAFFKKFSEEKNKND